MQDHAIQPYWQRFGSFFLYPLSMEPLLLCVAMGILTGLSELFFTPADLFIKLVLLVVVLRYGYKVLERTARGQLDDPLDSIDHSDAGKNRPYKQFVVIATGLALAGYAAYLGGPHLGILLLFLLAMVLPANTMLLALTDDLGESISPPHLWHLMSRIGTPYLGLCACLLLLTSSSDAFLGLLAPVLPSAIIDVVAGFSGTYFTIVMFRLMGYALYQYHEVLGFSVDVDFSAQSEAIATDPGKRLAKEMTALLLAGQTADAIALLRNEVNDQPDDPTANLRLHRLLIAAPGEEAAMLTHATSWLPKLLQQGKSHQASEILEAIWQQQPDYRPPLPTHYLPLAQALFERRRYENAVRLIKGFDQRHPGHRDIAAIYLLGARLLIDQQRDETQARRILETLSAHYPDSPVAHEAQRMLDALKQLANTGNA